VYDRFNRNINYLRISVTDRCNLRCTYCMPADGIHLLGHDNILSFDEIAGFVKVAVANGVSKVRITGGEPLVRKGIVTLVKMISEIDGISDFSMTTNGVLLAGFANELKESGLQRVNISLDTVDPDKYSSITLLGQISDVFNGIEAAIKAGLRPVKINCVINETKDEADAIAVADFCKSHDLEIRYIRQMDLFNGHFSVVDGGIGGLCPFCNRLRLTANGKLKPCLFNDIEFDIRTLGFEKAFKMAVNFKPEYGSKNKTGAFYNIGG